MRFSSALGVVASLLCSGVAGCDAGDHSAASTAATAAGGGATPTTTSGPALASSGASGAGGAGALAGTVAITSVGAVPISPLAFGQNYWNWEPSFGDPIAGTEATVAPLALNFMRGGGNNNDTQMPSPFDDAQIDAFVAYTRAVGAEPDLQVPLLYDTNGMQATAQTAADMVTYANKTKGYGIKYWSIGNEPDLYPTATGLPASFASYTAADYCASFKSYAAAMKSVDPTIKLLGPELSYKYVAGDDWLTPFLDACKDQVDVVTVHRYPIDPSQTTLDAAFADAAAFRAVVASLRANLDQHGLTSTPLAITEANITWDGTPSKSTLPASPSTFPAGLWTADVTGVALETGLFTNAFWHVADASTGWKLAFVLGGAPAPAFHALSLYTKYFAGSMLVVSGVPSGFSVYASRDAQGKTAVMVLNKTSAAAALALTFDSLPALEVSFEATSQTALVIPPGGGTAQVWRYTQALAAAGMGPAEDP